MTHSPTGCPVPHAGGVDSFPSEAFNQCPFPAYEELRDARVHQGERGEYMVFRWEDVVAVARDTDAFSSQLYNSGVEGLVNFNGGGERSASPVEGRTSPAPSSSSDPPEHRPKRALGLRMMSRRRLMDFEPMIRAHCDRLIDEWVDDGRCDFTESFANQLPVAVISAILGLPQADHALLFEWSQLEAGGAAIYISEERREEDRHRVEELGRYVRAAIDARLETPTEDFLSELIAAQVEQDGAMDYDFLVGEATLLLFAGNVTTTHMIGSALVRMCQEPGLEARLREDRSLIEPFMDEVLRLDSPIQWTQRFCRKDTEVGGVTIPAGAMVLLFWASGNRDVDQFPDAEALVLPRNRVANDHLAFGHGIHRCLGAPLARAEGRIAFEALLDRVQNIRLASDSDTRNLPSLRMWAPRRLVIDFDPAQTLLSARP